MARVTLPPAFPWVRNTLESTLRETETHAHRHDCWEISWSARAAGVLACERLADRPLPAQCLVVIPPGTSHQLLPTPGRRVRWEIVHCDAPGVLPLPWGAHPPDTGVHVLTAEDDALAFELGRALTRLGDRTGRTGPPGWQEEARALLWALLTRLGRGSARRAPGADAQRIAPALRLIQERWHQRLRIPALAAACALSPAQFRRRFRAATGVGPRRYLVQLRCQFAARFLRREHVTPSVTHLALQTGFGSADAFTRAFRSVMGCTPRRWRAGMG